MENFKKSEYVLTGSAESGLIYLYLPAKHILKKFKSKGFICFADNFLTGFFYKPMLIDMKNKLLRNSADELNKKFKQWKKRWQKHKEFYRLATKPSNNWRKNWEKLDRLNSKFWIESYQVETVDSFGTELNKIINFNLKKIGLDKDQEGELIRPIKQTPIQTLVIDRGKVKEGKMSKSSYMRKYWYCHGDWNGGELLTKELLRKDLKQREIKINLKSIKRLHQIVDPKLDKDVRNLIRLLRILSMWRDERKVLMQKINLSYKRVIMDAAKELKVNPNLIKYSFLKEIKEILINQEKFISREKMGVAIFDFSANKKKELIITGKEALRIISKFSSITRKSIFKGTGASKGLCTGTAMVILRKNEFFKFKKNKILITTMTRPEFFPLMKIAKAVITDEGGITSHAAIVSRELGIPCIVGTKIATKVLRNGDLIEVDANKGVVKILKK